jgi:hypothetical protein
MEDWVKFDARGKFQLISPRANLFQYNIWSDKFVVQFPRRSGSLDMLPPQPYPISRLQETFTPEEIERAIMTSSPKKAPGRDGIPFACLRQVYAAIPDHVNAFYSTLGAKGYHPRSWREATTAIIPKPNKPDYSSVKAYRPIALLNCMGKILEKLMATRLAQMAEAHHLLHPDQIGGRPQHSAIDAAMALMHEIETNAGTKWVTLALFLDVRGAFDNVSSAHLLHTMS